MLEKLKALVPKDKDLPDRAWRLTWLEEFRTSTIYDRLKFGFHEETTAGGAEYVPLASRRPSVRFGLSQIIVNDTTALLFSESHFPLISSEKTLIEDQLAKFVKTTKLRHVMMDAAVRGSVGSIAVQFRLLANRVHFKVLPTANLTPEWDPEEPDVLLRVTEKYKIDGVSVRALGYTVANDDDRRKFWFQRIWDRTSESWYIPWPVEKTATEKIAASPGKPLAGMTLPDERAAPLPGDPDPGKTVVHRLGFVPIEWIRNLPGGDDIDGGSTFEAALHNSIEMDYQLSQAGRGLKYTSDPTLLIREPAYQDGGPIKRGAANAIVTSAQGDVRMLEISGAGAAAVEGYVRTLRELSLELCGGNRASAERLSGAQSGKAMELMNQGLIWLADKLRTSYGEGALIGLLRMIMQANAVQPIRLGSKMLPVGALGDPADIEIVLKWPPWYPPTLQDHQAQALAIQTYRATGVLSRETAVKQIAHDFDIESPEDEIVRIDTEADIEMQRAVKQQELTRPFEYPPQRPGVMAPPAKAA